MTKYTNLSITEAIELEKIYCGKVQYMLVPRIMWFPVVNETFYGKAQYRIKTKLLNDFKKEV